ncbi:MAG: hypothetical protein J6Z16_04395 [Candidatus Methanomethylophilaceae archaeon]|nr:hypothetical protein [Candidatus Methanomethylophilaceae archaeon]
MSEKEQTSLEIAGGCAVGFTGSISCYNADAEARFSKALLDVGKWVVKESGSLLGHIKAAIVKEDGSGITLNLTDLENGVEHHGRLGPQEKVNFSFMCAVLDVDEHELKHAMWHALDDTGLDYTLDEAPCHCHDHDHGHEHHHHDGEHGCHGRRHGHGCHCPCCRYCQEVDLEDMEACDVVLSGTLSDLKPESYMSILEAMDAVWDWIWTKEGVPECIEVTIAPEDSDWAIITMTDKDFTLLEGRFPTCAKAAFRLECVAVGVCEHEIRHRAFHALEDSGLKSAVSGKKCCCGHDHD